MAAAWARHAMYESALRSASKNILSIVAKILTSNILNAIQNVLFERTFFLYVFTTEKRGGDLF